MKIDEIVVLNEGPKWEKAKALASQAGRKFRRKAAEKYQDLITPDTSGKEDPYQKWHRFTRQTIPSKLSKRGVKAWQSVLPGGKSTATPPPKTKRAPKTPQKALPSPKTKVKKEPEVLPPLKKYVKNHEKQTKADIYNFYKEKFGNNVPMYTLIKKILDSYLEGIDANDIIVSDDIYDNINTYIRTHF